MFGINEQGANIPAASATLWIISARWPENKQQPSEEQ